MPQRLVPVVPDCEEPAGQSRCLRYRPKPKCTEKGVGKKWFGMGIPADVCDDGAGEERGVEAVQQKDYFLFSPAAVRIV